MMSGAMKRFLPISLAVLPILYAGSAGAQETETAAPVGPSVARVSLAPLRIEMDGAQTSDTLRVMNPSNEPIGVQVRAFDWSQEDGKDVYAPSGDVRITPAIITIDAGKTQVFRIVRREMPKESERRYRIAIDQLPDPKATKTSVSETRIRFTIPMFVDRAVAAPAALAWSIRGDTLSVTNSGQQTPRMVNLALADTAGREIPIDGASLHYAMGGSTLRWTLPNGCPAGPVRLYVLVDGEQVDVPVQPSCT